MLNRTEREERKKQLGASEIYKILNFDTQECQKLWELKVGLREDVEIENNAVTAGNILEEACLEYYEKNNGEIIKNERIEHKNVKQLVASLDARNVNQEMPIENKVINYRTYFKWVDCKKGNAKIDGEEINIPKNYYCQVQIQMETLGCKQCILNVNLLTDEEQEQPLNYVPNEYNTKQIVVKFDEDLVLELLKRAKYFIECMNYKNRPSEEEYVERMVL